MKHHVAALGTALFLLSSSAAQDPGGFLVDKLRPALAGDAGEGLHLLSAEPEARRVVSPPALQYRLREPGELPGTTTLALTVEASGPAELELQLVYNDETPFLTGRRAIAGGGGEETVRWTVYKADQLTGIRLALRGGGATAVIHEPAFVPAEDLAPEEWLHAFDGEPFRLVRLPGESGAPLEFEWVVPASLALRLQGELVRAEFRLPNGTVQHQSLDIRTEFEGSEERPFSRNSILTQPSDGSPGIIEAEIQIRSGEQWRTLAATEANAGPRDLPTYEIPRRSIEDFAAATREGELVIYAGAGDEGARRREAPLPVESIWLAAGNGERWVLEEPLLRARRDTDWLAGGTAGLAAGAAGGQRYGFFTTIGANGRESLSLASAAAGSLRLTPNPRNPFWAPPAEEGAAPTTWRANAFFAREDAKLLIGLEQPEGAAPRVRVLTSPLLTRWVDLGRMPLPGLPEEAAWLTSYTDAQGMHHLLAGPPLRLYGSADALRGWEALPIEVPGGPEKAQLLDWDGRTWLFYLRREGGRGVVSWMPVERDAEGGFRAVSGFEFSPPPLRDEVQPPPPPLRLETLVQ